MPAAATKIWLPGVGLADIGMASLDAAVQEYDETLRFGRNEDTGQYCVFVIKRGMEPLPVLGWDELPDQGTVLRRLYQTDAVRNGSEILDNIRRHNQALESEDEYRANTAAEETAEAFEWGMRDMGRTSHKRVFLNPNRRVIGGWS